MSNSNDNSNIKTIGVFGGSFNPMHLGHALVAVTVVQTKDYVDEVVLVPVYKHAVKRDLLPFEDRVSMCQLAVQHFSSSIRVSTVEKDVGASNGAMLRALKQEYPPNTRLVWICGDDFFQWMHTPKGLETLDQIDGLIVQRRLHRDSSASDSASASEATDRFYKDPIDEQRVRQITLARNLSIDYIYGELPHFSSTLVRRAPGNWKSFLTNAVAAYLDQRPPLLQQLMDNLRKEDEQQQQQQDDGDNSDQPLTKRHKRSPSLLEGQGLSASVVLRGLEAIHHLQKERGHSSLYLSAHKSHQDHNEQDLNQARTNTDAVVNEIMQAKEQVHHQQELQEYMEVRSLAAELERIPLWLAHDRQVLQKYASAQQQQSGSDSNHLSKEAQIDAWLARLDLVEKYSPRIDVLMGCTVRALTEILQKAHERRLAENDDNPDIKKAAPCVFNRDIPELFRKWLEAKEMLGRERAVVCAGGTHVPDLVRSSLKLRQRTLQIIDTKERKLARVMELQQTTRTASMTTPEALHKLLEQLTRLEYTLLGAFSQSTPLPLVHRLLASGAADDIFDVAKFFEASTAAIDFLLSFAKALAASALASA